MTEEYRKLLSDVSVIMEEQRREELIERQAKKEENAPVRFTICCLNGHIWSEPETSKLGIRAKARIERGFIDALPVPCSECDECNEELNKLNRGYDESDS